jgi:hypothetical protein
VANRLPQVADGRLTRHLQVPQLSRYASLTVVFPKSQLSALTVHERRLESRGSRRNGR